MASCGHLMALSKMLCQCPGGVSWGKTGNSSAKDADLDSEKAQLSISAFCREEWQRNGVALGSGQAVSELGGTRVLLCAAGKDPGERERS